MNYFFTSESVSQGHPDKVMDQIADNLLDNFLAFDKDSHCAIEGLCTTGQVVLAGEVKSEAYVDIPVIVRETIKKIGYTKPEYQFARDSCGVLSAIHEQSPDIDMGVSREVAEESGAGDQGIMFGYATNETENYMPLTLKLAHMLVKELAIIREREPELMPYLRPDSKSQVTVEYDENTDKPVRIDTIVVSTQHDDFDTDVEMQNRIREDVINIVTPRVIEKCPERIRVLFGEDIKSLIRNIEMPEFKIHNFCVYGVEPGQGIAIIVNLLFKYRGSRIDRPTTQRDISLFYAVCSGARRPRIVIYQANYSVDVFIIIQYFFWL